MKGRRLIVVGLLLSLFVTPIAWAEGTTAGQDEGSWSDWLQNVVSWIQSIIEGPDPIPQDGHPLDLQDSQDAVQSVPGEEDRTGAIDPAGSK